MLWWAIDQWVRDYFHNFQSLFPKLRYKILFIIAYWNNFTCLIDSTCRILFHLKFISKSWSLIKKITIYIIYDLFEGKSSLSIQFVEGQFVDSYDPTIENSMFFLLLYYIWYGFYSLFYIRNINLLYFHIWKAFTKLTRVNSQDYGVKLVDTAGQDEYSIFPVQYSMDFHGYVLVYSITSQKSFEVIKIIYEKLLDVMGKK